MNREQIIRMASDAGLTIFEGSQDSILFDGSIVDALARFSALAAAHEREECAKACDRWIEEGLSTGDEYASFIRARGDK